MENETDKAKEISEMIRQVRSITTDQLRDYTRAKICTRPCPACGSSNWIYPMIKGVPAIYVTPSVNSAEIAEWAFHLSCGQCGNTRHINAGAVWEHVFDVKGRIYER